MQWNDDFTTIDLSSTSLQEVTAMFGAAATERIRAVEVDLQQAGYAWVLDRLGTDILMLSPCVVLFRLWQMMAIAARFYVRNDKTHDRQQLIEGVGYEAVDDENPLELMSEYDLNDPAIWAFANKYNAGDDMLRNGQGYPANFAVVDAYDPIYPHDSFPGKTVRNGPQGDGKYNFYLFEDVTDDQTVQTVVILDADHHPKNSVWQRSTAIESNAWRHVPGVFRGVYDLVYHPLGSAGYYVIGPMLYRYDGGGWYPEKFTWIAGHRKGTRHKLKHTRTFPREIYSLSQPGIEGALARLVALTGVPRFESAAVNTPDMFKSNWFGAKENGAAMGAVVNTPADERDIAGAIYRRLSGEWVKADGVQQPDLITEQANSCYDGDYLTGAFLNELRDLINACTVVGYSGGGVSNSIAGIESDGGLIVYLNDIYHTTLNTRRFMFDHELVTPTERQASIYIKDTEDGLWRLWYTWPTTDGEHFTCVGTDPRAFATAVLMDYSGTYMYKK